MMKKIISTLFAILIAAPAFAQTVPQWGFNASPRQLLYRGSGMSAFEPLNSSPHVATNAVLSASSTVAYPTGVWRDDYSAGIGASPLWFTPLTGNCAANALTNDGGYCVNSSDGNSWKAWHPASGVSVLQFGADKTGVAASDTQINAAAGTGNVKVRIPCGTFLLNNTIALSSNSELAGDGPCTTVKGSVSLSYNLRALDWYGGTATSFKTLVSNQNFAGTDHDIYVHDITFNSTLVTAGSTHMLVFASVSQVEVRKNNFYGAGAASNQNGTSFIGQSHDYTVEDNYAEGTQNACFDQWDGAYNFKIVGNTCEGGGYVLNGVQVNGISSGSPRIGRISHSFRIYGNRVRSTASTSIPVWGLCIGAVCGSVEQGEVFGNTIENDEPTGLSSAGIVVGDAQDIGVYGNTISDTRGSGIIVAGNTATSVTKNVVVSNNTLINVDTLGSGGANDNGIYVGNSTDAPDGVSLIGNTIRGGAYSYAIRVFNTSTNVYIVPGNMTAGASGTYLFGASTNPLLTGAANSFASGASGSDVTWKNTGTSDTLKTGVLVGGQATFDSTNVQIFRRSGVTKWTVDTNDNTSAVPVIVPSYAVASLPTCNAGRRGGKAYATDSNAALTAGIGAVVAAGGANVVPVGCDGTNWRIGG